LLMEVPFRDDAGERDVLVCVLVEHQSTPDPRMPLRVLLYAVLYWERMWKAWEGRQHGSGDSPALVPVVPIVFHTGHREWKSGRNLGDLFEAPEALWSFVPHWPVLFWEIAEHATDELLSSAGAFLQALSVVRAERESSETFHAVLGRVLTRLEHIEPKQRIRWHDLVHFVLSWAFHRRPVDEHAELQRIAIDSQRTRRRKREVETMSGTLAKTWDELEKNWDQLLVERELRARGESLRLILEERFTTIPPHLLERIEAETDVERLKTWTRRAVRIRSIDELQI
jgi:hypothetical protein